MVAEGIGSKEYGSHAIVEDKAVSEDVFCLGCATFQTYEILAEDPRHPSLAISSMSSPDGVEYYLLHTWTSRSNDVLQFCAVKEVASTFLLAGISTFSPFPGRGLACASEWRRGGNGSVPCRACFLFSSNILVTLDSPQSRSGGVQDGRDNPCLPDTRGANCCMEELVVAVY
jgi:hypothetical protein